MWFATRFCYIYGFAKVGDKLTYTITLQNGALATADWTDVTVLDVIPEGVTFAGNVQKDGQATTEYSYDTALRTLKLTPYAIAPDTQAVYTFDVTVDEGMQGKFIVNTAVLHDGEDTTPLPDTGMQIDEGEADPVVRKSANVTQANVGDTISYEITVKNGDKATAPWTTVVLKDTLDTSVVTPMLQDNVYEDGVLNNKWSFANKVFTLELGDIAPDVFREIKLTMQFKADAGGKTYVNYATGADDNGNATGQSPKVEIISAVDEPVTDIHYQLFDGYSGGKWRPGDRISLQEACTVAYRLISDGGNTWLERGTVTVPDYEYTIPEEAKYFVSIGVLPAGVFDTTQMTEDEDYEINYKITENGYLRIWATAAQLNTLVKYVTGMNAGVSGDVSRLTFAKVICQLIGRDTSPDTTGYSGNVQYYPDVTSSVDLVTEVSHEHDYMLDADGNEYWI